MRILITSGTGTIATELINNLLQAKLKPVIMSHNHKKLENLPAGVEGVFGDMTQPDTWEHVFDNIDKLCLITPAMLDEGKMGEAFAKKARDKKVDHIVFLGIHKVFTAPQIPHFESKIRIKNYLQSADKPYTVIEANNFFQNDSWFLPMAKSSGQYLQPIGDVGLNRVDVRDISLAMTNALLNESHNFKSYSLVGPEALTGKKTAQILSSALNRDVVYPSDCKTKWEEFIGPHIPQWLLEDWKLMYDHFISQGLKADSLDLSNQEKIIGRAPRRYEDFMRENI